MDAVNNFLKTKKGLEYLIHITNEYGTWNESKQYYTMPVVNAVDIAYAQKRLFKASFEFNWSIEDSYDEDLDTSEKVEVY